MIDFRLPENGLTLRPIKRTGTKISRDNPYICRLRHSPCDPRLGVVKVELSQFAPEVWYFHTDLTQFCQSFNNENVYER